MDYWSQSVGVCGNFLKVRDARTPGGLSYKTTKGTKVPISKQHINLHLLFSAQKRSQKVTQRSLLFEPALKVPNTLLYMGIPALRPWLVIRSILLL